MCSLVLAAATEVLGICLLYLVSVKMGHKDRSLGKGPKAWKLYESQSSYDRVVNRLVRPMSKEAFIIAVVTVFIVGLILFTLYFLLLTRKLKRDLKEIVRGIHSVTDEEEIHAIQIDRQDEIGMLADAVNDMTVKMQRLMRIERDK